MGNNYQVCNDCCHTLNLETNSFITSRCHRKFCDLCGWSSGDDLSMISKETVDKRLAINKAGGSEESAV